MGYLFRLPVPAKNLLILFLIRYPVQSNLLSLVVCGQHVVEGHDCHILADVLCGNRVLIAVDRERSTA